MYMILFTRNTRNTRKTAHIPQREHRAERGKKEKEGGIQIEQKGVLLLFIPSLSNIPIENKPRQTTKPSKINTLEYPFLITILGSLNFVVCISEFFTL